MTERWWIAWCARSARADVEYAVKSIEPEAKLVYARDAATLRKTLAASESKHFAVAVGQSLEGVSDINLAAAVVRDGAARTVMLVGRHLSGSLRSRASRAGVDKVIDLQDQQVVAPSHRLPPRLSVTHSANLREVPLEPEPARTAAPDSVTKTACKESHPVEYAARAEEGASTAKGLLEDLPSSAGTTGAEGAPVLVVSSGRGGVGKTTFAALAALSAASWGMSVALVDLDLVSGNLFTLFGLAHPPAFDASMPKIGIQTNGQAQVQQIQTTLLQAWSEGVAEVAPGVMLWGPCERPEMAEKVTPELGAFISLLAHHFDLVLIDGSTTCTDALAEAYQQCTRLLLVHDENLAAVGSLSRAAALAVRLGVARTQIVRVSNWGDRRVRFDVSVGKGELGLETARAFRLLDGGPEVAELLAAGKAQELVERRADPVPSVAETVARILDDLGKLPDNQDAREALDDSAEKVKRFHLLRRRAS